MFVKLVCCIISVEEPHHFYGAPASGENFDAAPAPAQAPTLIIKVNIRSHILFSSNSVQ
jgi:hypothetical protein